MIGPRKIPVMLSEHLIKLLLAKAKEGLSPRNGDMMDLETALENALRDDALKG